ncbi:MAG: AAA family ATPase, partial [Planctomycetota bacterium]|nr:AAA family ATPase [Planctomycetota bacterium]
MKIIEVHLNNFKRFTDVTISGIPRTAKLVVIIGPNGCGKSSLFDAFHQWYNGKSGTGYDSDLAYYRKSKDETYNHNTNVQITFDGPLPTDDAAKRSMYFRTAYRNEADFKVSNFSRVGTPWDQRRFTKLIQSDASVSQNYQRLVQNTLTGVYDPSNDGKTVATLREELIGRVRASMNNVFGDLNLNNISDPLGDGSFFFSKGSVASYHYKNLSGGEKSVFDLLLDLTLKLDYYN